MSGSSCWLTSAGDKKRKAAAVDSADVGDSLTGLSGGNLYAASRDIWQQVDQLWVSSSVSCYTTNTHTKNAFQPLSSCINALRIAAKNADGWAKEGLSGKDYLVLLLLSDIAVPTRGMCDPCKAKNDVLNAKHNLARALSGQKKVDNAKSNAKANAKAAAKRLQLGINLNSALRAAGVVLEPDLTKPQVDAKVASILQHPLLVAMLALLTSGYIGIGRYDGLDFDTLSDPAFVEPFKSMTRRGGYEQLLVHAGSGEDITVEEARGMVRWVPLYQSTNRVNAELMETAVHTAIDHLPLGVLLNRSKGRGASSYREHKGEVLLAPFVLFVMVFKGEVLYTDCDKVEWNTKVKQSSGI